jgi:hypothetical protein
MQLDNGDGAKIIQLPPLKLLVATIESAKPLARSTPGNRPIKESSARKGSPHAREKVKETHGNF